MKDLKDESGGAMGREKWLFLLERGDKKIFRIQKRFGKWIGYTLAFRGEVFETVDGRRVKTPPNWDFKTEKEAIAWALGRADSYAFGQDVRRSGRGAA